MKRAIFFILAAMALFLAGSTQAATIVPGDLIKASGAAVYYYANNGKRYVFPTEKTFKSWYTDFSTVKTISDAELSLIAIGGNVTYRPGTRLLKITTDPRTYAVDARSIRWITSESLATQLYGPNWATYVDDLPDPFFINYQYGAQITSASDYSSVASRDAYTTIQSTLTVVSPTPTPEVTTKAGNFRDPKTLVFPDKTFAFKDWSVRITPDLAFKNNFIRLILTTSDFAKRGNIIELKGTLFQINQNPATPGFGKVEEVVFRNDGTMGDDVANDRYFTARISANDWYDLVALTGIAAGFRDGTSESVTGLSGITFMIFDGSAEQMTVFEADHGVSVMSIAYKNAAQAFAQGVDLCYSGLANQIGSFSFRNGKAYYKNKQGNSYLETGGFINTITASDVFFNTVNPNNPEWSACSPITSHELIHSIFADTRKPAWFEEGLAEFTSREIAKTASYCETGGWRDGVHGVLNPYVSLSQQSWRSDFGHYMTATCAIKYINDVYGPQSVKNIYKALQTHASFTVNSYCGSGFDFYQNIIFSNTNVAMKDILESRFGIPSSELSCQAK